MLLGRGVSWADAVSSFVVPGGFTNTGLAALPEGNLAVGDFDGERIVIVSPRGALIRAITLESAPNASVQGVAWDASRSRFWVCHYATPDAGSVRSYTATGTLDTTHTLSLTGIAGPNGCVYDATNDRLLCAFNDNKVRGIDCTDGSIDETLTCDSTVVGSGTLDGVTLDPVSPSTRLWVSVDAPSRRIVKVNRSTGAAVSSIDCEPSPESIAWLNGFLYMCSDRLYHESLPNGNRVYWYAPEAVGTHIITGGYSAVYTG